MRKINKFGNFSNINWISHAIPGVDKLENIFRNKSN